ncbi:SURF1 family protein [Rhizobium tarimense]|nr:SURF1 family protein [Pseudorhizobium tarimense]MCJ8517531.1 SURF1 family protein [Pseudorhizobium tarimense]
MSRTRVIVTAVAVVAAMAILLSLGTWQVQRLHWKEQLLADMAERQHGEPVDAVAIAAMVARGDDIEYRRVQVTGTFDHQRERHFFATHEGRTGFYVYTPVTLEDGGVLFVNRGFIPYEMKDPALRVQGQVEGKVTLTGYARSRLDGKPSAIVPDNDPAKNIFYWKDLDAMTETASLGGGRVLPFFMDVDASQTNPGGWPQGGVTQFALPNNHLQYAVTWYGLAGALVVVVIGVLWRRRPGDRPQ